MLVNAPAKILTSAHRRKNPRKGIAALERGRTEKRKGLEPWRKGRREIGPVFGRRSVEPPLSFDRALELIGVASWGGDT